MSIWTRYDNFDPFGGNHFGNSGKIDDPSAATTYAGPGKWGRDLVDTTKKIGSDLYGNLSDYMATPIQDIFSGKPEAELEGEPKVPYDGPYWDGIHRGAAPKEINYLNADLAKAYGMDASTAYQEALSNTSYQRAVADLQAAGLNPILAAGKNAGAGGVYSANVVGDPLAGLSGSAKNVKDSQHDMWKALSNIGSLIGAGVGALTGKNVRSAYMGGKVGSAVGSGLGNLLDMF